MKNKFTAGLVLGMLAPAMGYAAPINWASESYEIWAQSEVEVEPAAPQVDLRATSLAGLPLVGNASASTANGNASVDLAVRNLSNSNAGIYEITTHMATSYSGGSDSNTQYAFAMSSATLANTFVAQTTDLFVTYDYSSIINMATSSSGLSYQEVTTFVLLNDLNQEVKFVDDYVDNRGSAPRNATTAGINYTLSGSGTHIFSGLTIGRIYTVVADISPDMFSSGTIGDNSSNSVIRVSFSDSVTAVPVPAAAWLFGSGLIGLMGMRKRLNFTA